MNETPPLASRIPEGVVNLADYERLAEQYLDPNAWAYFSGGAGDEVTVRWNREAFDRTVLMPRILRGGIAPDTRAELLGLAFAHPILVAPVAYQQIAHTEGERATAIAAAAQEAGLVLSTLSSLTLEDVAKAAGPRRWFQLYLQRERACTLDLVRRAEAAGYVPPRSGPSRRICSSVSRRWHGNPPMPRRPSSRTTALRRHSPCIDSDKSACRRLNWACAEAHPLVAGSQWSETDPSRSDMSGSPGLLGQSRARRGVRVPRRR
jgi:hypothetical protein